MKLMLVFELLKISLIRVEVEPLTFMLQTTAVVLELLSELGWSMGNKSSH